MDESVEGIAFIILEKGKLLVEKRKMTKKVDPGKIIIPGGHVEEGESPLQACKREMKEELDIECEKIKFVTRMPYYHPVENQNINYFLCTKIIGDIKTLEAEELFWIDPKVEKDKLDFDVDREALKKMFEMIKNE